jgi:molybdenum cofactor biosynthesis protein MoaC
MRDISRKINTYRTARAKAVIRVSPDTIELIRKNKTPKPDVLQTARVAAIQAAKNTSQIIPYCHPLPITHASVDFDMLDEAIEIVAEVKAIYKTGVEMEALTAASVAALTIYDMAKAVDDLMEIESIKLLQKTGGKSSFKRGAKDNAYTAAVLVISDSLSGGTGEDASGKLIQERLEAEGMKVLAFKIIPDEEAQIIQCIRRYADELSVNLIVTTGGTGVGPRDTTPEALSHLIEKDLIGVSEAMRTYGQERNPYAMLSRSAAGVRGKTVILGLPGSTGGVKDGLDAIIPAIFHAFAMIAGECHSTSHKQHEKSVK